MKPTGRKKRPVRMMCEKCGKRRSVERFQGKDLCRECLCADELPVYVPTLRSGLGGISHSGAHGFNVSAFSKEITKAMEKRGMKYDKWSGLKPDYKGGAR